MLDQYDFLNQELNSLLFFKNEKKKLFYFRGCQAKLVMGMSEGLTLEEKTGF